MAKKTEQPVATAKISLSCAAYGYFARKLSQGEHRCRGKDVILLGDVAERCARTIEIRCRRCERHGRLSIAPLLREHASQTLLWVI